MLERRNGSPLAQTVTELWREAVRRGSPAPFLVQEGGGWREVGGREAARAVDELAAGLTVLGLQPGDRVAIHCRSCLEWTLVDYALISLGVVSATVFPSRRYPSGAAP